VSDVWGVGCYDARDRRRPWTIGQAEIQRDMGGASRRLADLGIGAADRVLFCSMLSEAGQFWPLIVATMLVGAQLSCADATAGEAPRVEMFLARMTYRAVIGVTDVLVEALVERGIDLHACFANVDVLAARPGAYERLVAAGLAPYRFALCGPAVAIAPGAEEPAWIDGDEWHLDADHDGVLLTNLQPRATSFARAAVAIRGDIIENGKAITWPSAR
jgi:hypothetical protein